MIKIIFPIGISLKDWAAALVTDYPNEYLPVLTDENKWHEWGAIVAGTGLFARAAIPPPFVLNNGQKDGAFETWESWATVVYNIMANEDHIIQNLII